MANLHRTLYTGVTSDLEKRVAQHKADTVATSFTSRYRLDRLVFCEPFADVGEAIAAEKRIKGWLRKRKVALIEAENPEWRDLSVEVCGEEVGRKTDSSLRSE